MMIMMMSMITMVIEKRDNDDDNDRVLILTIMITRVQRRWKIMILQCHYPVTEHDGFGRK